MAGITLTERDTELLQLIIDDLGRPDPEPEPWRVLEEISPLLHADEVGVGPELTDRERFLLRLLRPHVEEYYQRWRRQHPASVDLTPRQLAVLGLVRDGYTNGQIGRRLHLSEGTVRTHLNNAYERLGVQSRTAAVAAVFRDGG